jgi:polysaccharide pyruvyl transferase WcaK-like protein
LVAFHSNDGGYKRVLLETKVNERFKIGLLGVSFETGNLGVNALAEASIKVILSHWPNAEVILLGTEYVPQQKHLSVLGREINIRIIPIRFSKNIFLPYHFLVFVFYGLLMKMLRGTRFEDSLVRRNEYFKTLVEIHFVADINAGDSFSDIYGYKRFILLFLRKWLVTFLGKELILLPQTYGPFKNPMTRKMARYILKRAGAVYARDHSGVEYVRDILGNHSVNGKIRFVPDVAFVLDSRKPENIDVGSLSDVRTEDSIVVGLNISGLLFNGGYTRENMFGLKTNYRQLIYSAVDFLMKDKRLLILLVPHVFAPSSTVEDDPGACLKVYEKLSREYPGRIFLTQGKYDHNEIKYIIGLCDFFIGSRMHACIAALSQSIPAVGIAYSKKFHGVFESIGLKECVAEACTLEKEQILEIIRSVFRQRDKIRIHLENTIPNIKKDILNMI